MAHSDRISDDALDAIGGQIGALLPASSSLLILEASTLEVTETFAVWALDADAVSRAPQAGYSLRSLAQPTYLWHHQIAADGQAAAFARSTRTGLAEKDWSVRQVAETPIAARLAEAIAWIDRGVEDDPLVRLLVAPDYHLHAFWLLGPDEDLDRIVVADRPEGDDVLQYGREYGPREFFDTLARLNPVVGLQE